jgi:hypothetical protein
MFFCSSLTLLLLIGLRSWWRKDPYTALAYILPIAMFPLAYYVSHPLMDYRQPIEPEIVVLVVVGLRELRSRLRSMSAADSSVHGLDSPDLNLSFDSSLATFADYTASAVEGEPSAAG